MDHRGRFRLVGQRLQGAPEGRQIPGRGQHDLKRRGRDVRLALDDLLGPSHDRRSGNEPEEERGAVERGLLVIRLHVGSRVTSR